MSPCLVGDSGSGVMGSPWPDGLRPITSRMQRSGFVALLSETSVRTLSYMLSGNDRHLGRGLADGAAWVTLKTAVRLWAFDFRVAIQADMRGQNRFTFWVKVRICLYRLGQQPYSLQPKASSRIDGHLAS